MASVAVSPPTNPSPAPQDELTLSKAHHRGDGKGFVNPWPSFKRHNFTDFVKYFFIDRITGKRKNNKVDTTPPHVPVHPPTFLPSRETSKLRATWLGHACFYVEFPGGLRVLFDPVFTQRCSPISFLGPSRYTEMPCQIEDIPIIDAVVISHNHYDHMSYPTLMKIKEKHKQAHFFVPLGNEPWFTSSGFKNVTELDWWEEREFKLTLEKGDTIEATFSCLPCQHMTSRTGIDMFKTLWASWSVSSGGKKIWFGGDTGYRSVPELPEAEWDYGEKYSNLPHCPAFKHIGDLRGPFDLGLIPIGAYNPRFLMSPVHCNPYDSVNIFVDTKCEKALGIHWGTWVLTQEPVLEPPQMLKEALKWKGIADTGVFDVCDIGDSTEF